MGVLQAGEKCWSECGPEGAENCRARVLVNPEHGKLEFIRHPACTNHTECVGSVRRVVCEAKWDPDDMPPEEDDTPPPPVQAASMDGLLVVGQTFLPSNKGGPGIAQRPTHMRGNGTASMSIGAAFL